MKLLRRGREIRRVRSRREGITSTNLNFPQPDLMSLLVRLTHTSCSVG